MTTISQPAAGTATPPPNLSPGGRTAIRVLLIIGAAVLVVGLVVSLSAAAWGISSFRVIKDSVALPATLTAVTVDTGSVPAAVRITTDREAREPRVDMRMVNSARSSAEPLSVTADGTTAQVRIDAEPSELLRWSRFGEITVVLPPDVSRRVAVTTQQEAGVVFAQADVDSVTARTVNGSIVLGGSARRVEATSQRGDIRTAREMSVSESLRATTTWGDITLDFAESAPPQTVDATTERGDVAITLPPPGPYFVDAAVATRRGSAVVSVPRTQDRDAAAAVVTARTDTGDVVIEESY